MKFTKMQGCGNDYVYINCFEELVEDPTKLAIQVSDRHFLIFDGKIMPSLASINGMGEKAAESIVEARKQGEFISIEDFRNRTKISKTLIEMLKEEKILKGLPETNQISLFM